MKVSCGQKDPRALPSTSWYLLDKLQVPDFSKIEPGLQVSVKTGATGTSFACIVVQVSKAKARAQAPVNVHYKGYSTDDDEWVGADRLQSRQLRFLQPKLPKDVTAERSQPILLEPPLQPKLPKAQCWRPKQFEPPPGLALPRQIADRPHQPPVNGANPRKTAVQSTDSRLCALPWAEVVNWVKTL